MELFEQKNKYIQRSSTHVAKSSNMKDISSLGELKHLNNDNPKRYKDTQMIKDQNNRSVPNLIKEGEEIKKMFVSKN